MFYLLQTTALSFQNAQSCLTDGVTCFSGHPGMDIGVTDSNFANADGTPEGYSVHTPDILN